MQCPGDGVSMATETFVDAIDLLRSVRVILLEFDLTGPTECLPWTGLIVPESVGLFTRTRSVGLPRRWGRNIDLVNQRNRFTGQRLSP